MIKKLTGTPLVHIPKKICLLVVVILAGLISLGLRLYRLGEIPLGLYWDEVAMLADSRFVANTGLDMTDHHWLQSLFFSYGDYKLPVYIWLTTVWTKLFSASDWVLRLTSALAGLGTIFTAVILSKKLFLNSSNSASKISKQTKNIELLLVLSGIVAVGFSPWAILFARTGFEGHLGQFLMGLAVLLAALSASMQHKLGNLKKLLLLVATQLMAVAATYTYFSVRFVWPVVFLATQILLWQNLQNNQSGKQSSSPDLVTAKSACSGFRFIGRSLATIILPLILYFLLLVPMTRSPYFEASNRLRYSTTSVINMEDWALKSNQLRQTAGNQWWTRAVYHRHWLMLQELLKNYADHLSPSYIFVQGDQNLRHGTGYHGLYLLPLLPIFFIGLFSLAKKKFKVWLLLIIWWLAALLPASVPETTPHALRSLNALLPLSLIIVYGMYQVLFSVLSCSRRKQLINKFVRLLFFGWVIWLIISLSGFTFHYFRVYPQLSADDWQTGFKPVALKICQLKDSYDQVWVDINDGRFFLWPLAYCSVDNWSQEQIFIQDAQTITLGNIRFELKDPDQFRRQLTHDLIVTDGEWQDLPSEKMLLQRPYDDGLIKIFESNDLYQSSQP